MERLPPIIPGPCAKRAYRQPPFFEGLAFRKPPFPEGLVFKNTPFGLSLSKPSRALRQAQCERPGGCSDKLVRKSPTLQKPPLLMGSRFRKPPFPESLAFKKPPFGLSLSKPSWTLRRAQCERSDGSSEELARESPMRKKPPFPEAPAFKKPPFGLSLSKPSRALRRVQHGRSSGCCDHACLERHRP
jgi:hypothetical protein